MGIYIKLFDTHSQYESYTADTANFILPNVSYCKDQANVVHYNPYVEPIETRMVAKFNVTDTSRPTPISFKTNGIDGTSGFSAIEIDGVEQPSVVSAYTFSTTGEHTVKYTLTDPTSIGDYAFFVCDNLLSVDMPNSVTSIGEWCFANCHNLEKVNSNENGVFNIPIGVTSISGGTFSDCSSLTSCTIGNNVTSIEYEAFHNCSGLVSINIPSGVTFIDSGAFCNCNSLDATTVAAIETIEPDAFYCS